MIPILISIGPIQVYTLGVFLVLAFLCGTFVLWREGVKSGYNEDKLMDLAVWVIFWGWIGARAYYVLSNWGVYSSDITSILRVWEGGLSFHGALIGGIVSLWWFVRKNKWPFLQVADFATLSTLLGMMIGKIGSFLNGDDYGVTTNLPWAVQIPGVVGRRHPSPIYEAVILFVIYNFLLSKYRKKERSGGIFYSFLLLLGISRIFTEFFRDNKTHIWGIKEGFWAGVILVILGATQLYWFYKKGLGSDQSTIIDKILGPIFKLSTNEPATLLKRVRSLRGKNGSRKN